MVLESLLQKIENELVNAITLKNQPFRYFVLGTALENTPRLRTVVLRAVGPDFSLVFYTDKRSKKVSELLQNPRASALFYDPEKFLQLRMDGALQLQDDEPERTKLWESIPERSRKDYTALSAPGNTLENPEKVEHLKTDENFCVIKLIPSKMEYLQLNKSNHTRAEFVKRGNEWAGQFLVP